MIPLESAASLARLLADRKISAAEVADAYLGRINELDSKLGCFLAVDADSVKAQAKAVQEKIDNKTGGPLAGVPIALKDNISTQGLETTCASKILKGYVPPYDATVVERLKAAGMPILGKTNMDEFAMGTSTETSAFQKTTNPWDTERSPGGSSGGSAASVAGGLAPVSLGSDTGGSIRQPASLCGVVGFKPTYGRVSRYGLVAFASSLDQIGPFARTVEDAALLAATISGHDPMDGTSLPSKAIDVSGLKQGSLKGVKFALPTELFGDAIEDGVKEQLEASIKLLEAEGVIFKRVSMPSVLYGVTTYYIIAPAEASSNLARFDGVRYGALVEGGGHIENFEKTRAHGFGREVRTRIMIGTYALSAGYYDAYYLRATQVRTKMRMEVEAELKDVDAVLCPTSPGVAFKIGELLGDPLALKMLDICTIPANMGGFPAISVPCGLSQGLPVGLQIMGGTMADERVLQLAYAVEQALPKTPASPLLEGVAG
ncbi:MAG: Asp-tRNA(Asn)/Glu-tRNA(Gln) amidotransferase subunit GatA [Armatimonadetes bacterium]|nr:Asp-tRNA(Asn)/Glu-tRNA(Gln) amidotransferase subunit GatA [Armatimonadota bacterium]